MEFNIDKIYNNSSLIYIVDIFDDFSLSNLDYECITYLLSHEKIRKEFSLSYIDYSSIKTLRKSLAIHYKLWLVYKTHLRQEGYASILDHIKQYCQQENIILKYNNSVIKDSILFFICGLALFANNNISGLKTLYSIDSSLFRYIREQKFEEENLVTNYTVRNKQGNLIYITSKDVSYQISQELKNTPINGYLSNGNKLVNKISSYPLVTHYNIIIIEVKGANHEEVLLLVNSLYDNKLIIEDLKKRFKTNIDYRSISENNITDNDKHIIDALRNNSFICYEHNNKSIIILMNNIIQKSISLAPTEYNYDHFLFLLQYFI